jgi:hypothetical protein
MTAISASPFPITRQNYLRWCRRLATRRMNSVTLLEIALRAKHIPDGPRGTCCIIPVVFRSRLFRFS